MEEAAPLAPTDPQPKDEQPALLPSQPLVQETTDAPTPNRPDPHEARAGSITINETEDGEKRIRRTTREIKRPKFDDELVDSGIGLHSFSKRRLSERSNSSISTVEVQQPPPVVPLLQPFQSIPDPSIVIDTNVATVSAEPSPMEIPVSSASWGEKGDPADSSKRHDLRQRTNMISVKDRMAMDEAIQEEEAARLERKRREARVASKDIRAKEIAAANEAAEVQSTDLDTWTAEDDIALVSAITHVSDMSAVHRGIRFSKDFTYEEIEERWYRVMYDDTFSRQAKKRMLEVPPLEMLRVQSRTIFSAREEEILRCIPASNEPDMKDMAEVLRVYPQDFHSARTPQILLDHWHLIQMSAPLGPGAPPPAVRNFPEWERLERNTMLTGANATTESNLIRSMDSMEQLQKRLAKVLVDEVAGIVNDSHLPEGAVATLRGCVVRYVLLKPGRRGIVLGRSTAEKLADIDLSLEGPASKVARRQATITQEATGEFWLTNEGKRALVVDSKPVLQHQRVQLNDNAVLEVSCLRLLFRFVRR